MEIYVVAIAHAGLGCSHLMVNRLDVLLALAIHVEDLKESFIYPVIVGKAVLQDKRRLMRSVILKCNPPMRHPNNLDLVDIAYGLVKLHRLLHHRRRSRSRFLFLLHLIITYPGQLNFISLFQ